MLELPYMTDEAKGWIGHETVEVSDPVSLRQIREYLAGTDDWNPLYYDEEYAKRTPYGGIIAPRMFYRVPLRKVLPESALQEDGQYPDRSVPGVFGRSMAGGQEVEVFEPVRPGDVLTLTTTVLDIYEKQGRSGRLIFQVNRESYSNQRGEQVAVEIKMLIFR